jgi:hypothetical protein
MGVGKLLVDVIDLRRFQFPLQAPRAVDEIVLVDIAAIDPEPLQRL